MRPVLIEKGLLSKSSQISQVERSRLALSMAPHVCNPSTWEVEVEGSAIPAHLPCHEFEAGSNYMGSHLRKTKQYRNNKDKPNKQCPENRDIYVLNFLGLKKLYLVKLTIINL